MRTFTLRDLDRQPGEILDACEREGAVRIKRRDGRTYTLTPAMNGRNGRSLPDFKARMKAAGMKKLSYRSTRLLDKLIAGE